MNVRGGKIALGVLALIACAFGGRAEAGSLVTIGLGAGVTVPVSDVGSAFDDGVAGQGFVKFNIPFIITPRLDFVFQDMDIKDASIVAPDFGPGNFTGGTQTIMSGLAHAQFNIITAGPITPYLIAGVGMSNLETSLDEEGGGSTSHSVTRSRSTAGRRARQGRADQGVPRGPAGNRDQRRRGDRLQLDPDRPGDARHHHPLNRSAQRARSSWGRRLSWKWFQNPC
jgi:opacity protein-like surface antigen